MKFGLDEVKLWKPIVVHITIITYKNQSYCVVDNTYQKGRQPLIFSYIDSGDITLLVTFHRG